MKSVDPNRTHVPEKSVRIEIIIEKIEKTNHNPGRDDIISRLTHYQDSKPVFTVQSPTAKTVF